MFVAEAGDDLVPVGCVAEDRGGDASSSRAGEQACVGGWAGGEDALGHEWADLFNDGDLPGALAFGAFVGESSGCGCGLAPYRPDPLGGVDVCDPATGDFPDPGGGARGEEDDFASAAVVVVRSGDECVGQADKSVPVGQGEGPGVAEFVRPACRASASR